MGGGWFILDYMNTNGIVAQLDAEISRLEQARVLISGTAELAKRKPGRPTGMRPTNKSTRFDPATFGANTTPGRTMSPEVRAKPAAAQKARWAKVRKAAKKDLRAAAATTATKTVVVKGITQKTTPVKKAVSVKKAAGRAGTKDSASTPA